MMSQWLINFFAGFGVIETVILVVGGLVTYFAIKNAPEEEEQ